MIDKAVDSTALDSALTDIANAIRAKTGGTNSLTLEQMPSEIEGIETGVTGKSYIDTSQITDFTYFCMMDRFTYEQIENLDTSNGTRFTGMFQICNNITKIPQLNTSNVTDFSYMLANCPNLKSIPILDTSKGRLFSCMFYECPNLTEIPQIDLSNAEYIEDMFYNCSSLTTVRFIGTITLTNDNFIMNYSDNLTVESMMSAINAFSDNSDLSQTYTAYFGATNLAKLTDEQKAVATAKNIALA